MDLLNFYSSSDEESSDEEDEEDYQNNFRNVEQGTPVSLSQKNILANSNLKSNFPGQGYWIMDITPYFTHGEFEKLTKFVWNKKRFKTIFNEELALGNTFANDNKRFISEPINNKTNGGIKALNECLKQLAQFCNSQWEPKQLVVLKSEKGCARQAIHADGKKEEPEIGSALISIQEGTKIFIGNRTVFLKKGMAILFHGLVPHAGEAYEEMENRRLHVYFVEKGRKVPKNAVFQTDLECKFCGKVIVASTKYSDQSKKDWYNKRRMNWHHNICTAK